MKGLFQCPPWVIFVGKVAPCKGKSIKNGSIWLSKCCDNPIERCFRHIAMGRRNWEDILTRMKDGDKDYKSMLPCYYVEKSDEVKECA